MSDEDADTDRSDAFVNERSENSDTDSANPEHTKRWNNKAAHDREHPYDAIDVKNDWVGITVYLPPSLRDELELGFRHHSYECKRNSGTDLKKLRHFYPLVVALGLEQLENTDAKDVLPLLSYVMDEHT